MINHPGKMPRLGFGLMRLPKKDDAIDLEQVCRMADASMAAGMNYFDTAYVYHGGLSEHVAGEVLTKRYPRKAFRLATKLPAWKLSKAEDCDRILKEQLERTGAGYFDFYLLHSVEDGNIATYEKYDCFGWALKKKEEGLIRHFGFSFHGSPALLEKVLDAHPETEFVQIQLNYADWENPVVRSGQLYEILLRRQIPMIIMEPVKGGTLASLKPELEEIFKRIHPDWSMASWALRFVGSLPGVMTILSGMSSMEQMEDNLATFHPFEPLSGEEKEAVMEVRRRIMDMDLIGCTACRYCVDGCPQKISIPDVFRCLNTMTLYQETFRPRAFYNGLVSTGAGKASDCIACGQCEKVCPQHLEIISLMRQASEKLEG